MFDFFFKKRSVSKSSEVTKSHQQSKPARPASAAAELVSQQSKKQIELARAASFSGQEQAALAFILQADYPDARLQAAMHIHSPEALLQVSRAMRNKDRRVSKLVQEKLTQLKNQQNREAALQACLSEGRRLLENTPVWVNQVAQWDRQCADLGESGDSSMSTLMPIKLELEQRLQAQLDLQRQAVHVAQTLCALTKASSPSESLQLQLDELTQQCQQIQSSSLLPSLPKNQLDQLHVHLAAAQSYVQQLAASTIQVIDVEPEPISSIDQEVVEVSPKNHHEAETETRREASPKNQIDVKAGLVKLEQALMEGSLEQALDLDKALTHAGVSERGEIPRRLRAARLELKRLSDWAKWGGTVSREELFKVAEGLLTYEVTDHSSASELAKRVGGLRARWKELDRTSGAANHAMWERFNTACSHAYQNADAYFKQQAQRRSDNLHMAQAQLAALDEVILDSENHLADWKTHQHVINQAKLEWRKLGSVDRKLKASLDAEFDQKIAALLQPLTAARQASIAVRHQLTHSVTQIVATERNAVEKVQQVQQRWQQEAGKVPLERKDEQNLWNQFRVACDAVFEQRKANLDERHQQRHQIVLKMQSCCEELESCLEQSTRYLANQTCAEIMAALRKAKQEWRELAAQLNGQYRQTDSDADLAERLGVATDKLEKRHAEFLAQDNKAQLINLRTKINICAQIEEANQVNKVTLAESDVDHQNVQWKTLATNLLPVQLNKLLTQRFNNALAQIENQPASETQIEERLLRIESLRGLASPPESAQQRLQLQVQDLQSALKNRDASRHYSDHFYALCALPGRFSPQQEQRLQLILEDFIRYYLRKENANSA